MTALNSLILEKRAVIDRAYRCFLQNRDYFGLPDVLFFLIECVMHYLLIYDLAPDYLKRRPEFRKEHLGLAWEAADRGELILGGALADPVDSAVLLFRAESPEPLEKFVAADPYVKNGLVKSWRIRPWTTVVGEDAVSPVR